LWAWMDLTIDLFLMREDERKPVTCVVATQKPDDVSHEYRQVPPDSVGSLTRC
jgi:hypothetical protein